MIILENTFEVMLNRGQAGLGLSLSGGLAENKPIEIIDIYPNQPAALSGRFEIGDIILSINDFVMLNRNVRVCLFYLYKQNKSILYFSRMYQRLLVMQREILNLLFVDLIVENIKLTWFIFCFVFIILIKILIFVLLGS